VTVVDTTPPVITCASNKTVECGICGPGGAAFDFTLLHTFGLLDDIGRAPEAALVVGSDGALYGTASAGGTNGGGTVFKLNTDGSGFTVLHHFLSFAGDGAHPAAAVLEASDGMLYGTTQLGGTANNGTVFRLNKDGSGYSVVHSFDYSSGDGRGPAGALLQASDGLLYGTTANGGNASDAGTLFELNLNGSGYTVLHYFKQTAGDGANPVDGLVEGSNHALYGTSGGGTNGLGTIFAINQDGTGYTNLYNFGSTSGDGSGPQAPLVASGGVLYGIASANSMGGATVFRINEDGSSFSVVNTLSLSGGNGPNALSKGSDGTLYGTAQVSGPFGTPLGGVFKLNPDGTSFEWLHVFPHITGDGTRPVAAVLEVGGRLYGTTTGGGTYGYGTVFALDTNGDNYAVLKSFAGGEGSSPRAGLLAANNGLFYGTAGSGGAAGLGSVYRINPDGSGYVTLHSFGLYDGAGPTCVLVAGSDGALYGTTGGGGYGFGTAFKLNRDGSGYQVMRNFFTLDGEYPQAGLLAASDGMLYGTASDGGANGLGTVFKLSPDGSSFTVLYNFTGASGDGASPRGTLIEGSDGALYGTTLSGGVGNYGTIFTLNKNGSDYSVLRDLAAGDGTRPEAGLLEASDGDLYGTASVNAGSIGGTVFKLHKNGSNFAVLHTFTGGAGDGSYPFASLVEGNDGALYGTTSQGGPADNGTVFALNKDGSSYTVLKIFDFSDGVQPLGSLTIGGDGALYGTTLGTVFKLQCPLGAGFDIPTALDGCSGVNVTLTVLSTLTNGTCPQVVTRTWSASDPCGNSNTCSQTITVVDTTRPVLTCASNKTVECGSPWTFDEPGASDNCCTNVTLTVLNTVTNGTCPQIITRTWQAADCCTNISTCSQTVTVVDTTPPALFGIGKKTVECGSTWTFDVPTASDMCSGTNVIVSVLSTVTNGTCPEFITRTWVATDLCGNTNTQSEIVKIVDTTPPTMSCASNKTVECGSAWTFDAPTAFDTCSGANVVVSILSTVTNGTCPQLITQTWVAVDACGNTNTCSQTVTVVDTTPPVIICASNKTVACSSCYATSNLITDTVLWNFSSSGPDGQQPQCALVEGFDGSLYGTASDSFSFSSGTVYKLNKDGTGFTILHTFSGGDGRNPYAGLLLASDGVLYGTTFSGGPGFNGTVFKLNQGGTLFTPVHAFNGADGYGPQGGVLEGSDGALYGCTYGGAAFGSGNLFVVQKNGTGFSVLHQFGSSAFDGLNGIVRLTEGSDGVLYGVTPNGGSNSVGTVFRIDKSGSSYQVLYHFGQTATDGKNPLGALIEGSNHALYGTTSSGGTDGNGTVFMINTNGTGYATLYNFSSSGGDGQSPVAGLVIGADGGLYGTTRYGGAGSRGTVFRLNQDSTSYQVLYSFMAGGDASNPYASLLQASDGAFYGTTLYGGTNSTGTVFKLGCDWHFDTPTAFDTCCGSNVVISVIGTVTNGPCPQTITRTWGAFDCCSNVAMCSQSFILTNEPCAPPVITHLYYSGHTFTIIFRSQPCSTYEVQYEDLLTDPSWSVLLTITATGNSTTVQDVLATTQTRFYRIVCVGCP
jgi:uncharacterized repeat protein (TIGR03803 family)